MGEIWDESGRGLSQAIPLNTKYNPLVYGARGLSTLFGKGIAEAMEAVDEARARRGNIEDRARRGNIGTGVPYSSIDSNVFLEEASPTDSKNRYMV